MKQTITTSIDRAEYAELELMAKAEDRSVASLLRKATREFLRRRAGLINRQGLLNQQPEAAATAGAGR